MERDEYLPSRRVVAGHPRRVGRLPSLETSSLPSPPSPPGPGSFTGHLQVFTKNVYKAASDRVLGVPGRSAARRFARHVTALRSSRRDRATRPKARLDIGLGRARAPARPNATL